MSKYLISFVTNLNIYTKNNIFIGIESVSHMFSYYLQKEKIIANGIGKIIILFSEKNDIDVLPDGILICHFFPKNLPNISQNTDIDEGRKLYAHDIYSAIIYICNQLNIKIAPFQKTYDTLKEKNFKFKENWKINKWNSSRTYKASIKWNYKENIYLYAEIFNKEKNLNEEIFIAKTKIGLGILDSVLGKLVWQNEKTLLLFHLNKRDYWIIDIETKEVTFVFPRAESGDPHGQFDLGKMYYNGSTFLDKNEALGLSWIKKSADQGFKSAIKFLEKIK